LSRSRCLARSRRDVIGPVSGRPPRGRPLSLSGRAPGPIRPDRCWRRHRSVGVRSRCTMAMIESTQVNPEAGDQYLLLADISGYTAFLASVEQAHGVDFSDGIPAGYSVLGELLGSVIEGVEPEFAVAKLEGDAVFAVA